MDHAISAVFVGDGSLLVRCVQAWVQSGQAVVAIASSDPQVQQWAQAQGHRFEWVEPSAGAEGDTPAPVFEAADFDLLWSIGWLHKLPTALVARARQLALNFHDGPLPHRRGLHVPAWALLEGARHHGISWHEISPQIDAGRVARSLAFELSPDETAYSLNAHCHEAGFNAFLGLLEDLRRGAVALWPQTGPARLHRRADRPPMLATLDWTQPAQTLAAQVRALDFAHTPNPLGLPKVWCQGRVVAVRRARVVPGQSPPGTLTRVTPATWQVATVQGTIALEGLTAIDGGALPQCAVGQVLTPVPQGLAEALGQALPALARAESRLAPTLRSLQAVRLPHPRRGPDPAAAEAHIDCPLHLPPSALRTLPEIAADALAALAGWAAALVGAERVGVAALDASVWARARALSAYVNPWLPVQLQVQPEMTREALVAQAASQWAWACETGPWPRDLVLRLGSGPAPTAPSRVLALGLVVGVDPHDLGAVPDDAPPEVCLIVRPGATPALPWHWHMRFDAAGWTAEGAREAARQFQAWWQAWASTPAVLAQRLLRSQADRDAQAILEPPAVRAPFNGGIWAQVAQTLAAQPHAQVLEWPGGVWSAEVLQREVGVLAAALQARGIGRGEQVGVCLPRSPQLLVAVLAVLACGAAYVPLDPDYPPQRLRFMCEDAALRWVVALPELTGALGLTGPTCIAPWAGARLTQPAGLGQALPALQAEDLAYLIYTSGSTGQPKGVEVRQGEVVQFFAGMDSAMATVPMDRGEAAGVTRGRWLAVTSLSFDISVLELLWTLSRGYTVVLHGARGLEPRDEVSAADRRPLAFSLFYFASGSPTSAADEGAAYRLLREGARFADDHGWTAVWVPERHFHDFGGPYPNPVVLCAALAAWTRRTQLRAGSCVLPLHHPIRVAEDWALVDRLSGGRVGVSFAAGWQPQDFVLAPQAYAQRQQQLFESISTVQRLWRGETLTFPGPSGTPVTLQTRPRPVQPELPVWVTAASHPRTFAEAGRRGCHVLTHLLGQTLDGLASKVQGYRQAWREAGHAGEGQVALMLHAFVGDDGPEVLAMARAPLKAYLRSALDLIRRADWQFPTWTDAQGPRSMAQALEAQPLTEPEVEALLEHAVDRYCRTSALIGTPDQALERLRAARAAGVDEVACLIDFGIPADTVLAHLGSLQALRARALADGSRDLGRSPARPTGPGAGSQAQAQAQAGRALSVGEALQAYRITHLQCTPSQAAILLADRTGRQGLSQLSALLVGGEALPAPLGARLRQTVAGPVFNLYGPTEATVWATCAALPAACDLDAPGAWVPLGQPLQGVTVHLRTPWGQACPPGVPGEVWLGGLGLARGYRDRPALTAERFPADPQHPGRRLYRTGDLARWHRTGGLEFLGRMDDQVKVHGHRVELGEIEAALLREPGVAQAVVVAVPDAAGRTTLQAYVTAQPGQAPQPLALTHALAAQLPAAWLPQGIALRADLPRTPNGKVDRAALRAVAASPAEASASVPRSGPPLAPTEDPGAQRAIGFDARSVSAWERVVTRAWCQVLRRSAVPPDANFFDVGGYSLAAIQVQRLLREATGIEVAVIDLFRWTTVQGLARHLAGVDRLPDAAIARRDRSRRRLGPAAREATGTA